MRDVRRVCMCAVALTATAAALAPQAASAAVVKSTAAPSWQTNGRVRSVAIGAGKILHRRRFHAGACPRNTP
jgi:hypothetical protein